MVGGGLINDAIALKNDFPNIVSIGFGYVPIQVRETGKRLRTRQDALDELPGINWRVLADIRVQMFESIACGIRPDKLYVCLPSRSSTTSS